MKNHGPAMQVRGTPACEMVSFRVPLTWEPGQCWSPFQSKITFLKANRYKALVRPATDCGTSVSAHYVVMEALREAP